MSFEHSEPIPSLQQSQSDYGPTIMQSQASQSSATPEAHGTPFVSLSTNQIGGQQILFSRQPAGSGPNPSGPSTSGQS